MEHKNLFEEFSPVSFEAWKAKINTDLKGKKTFDDLIWHSDESISVLPAYHADIVPDKNRKIADKNLTEFDKPNDWRIHYDISIDDVELVNNKLLNALRQGVNSIEIIGEIDNYANFKKLLQNIDITIVDIHFSNQQPQQTLQFLAQYCKDHKIDTAIIRGSVSNPVNVLEIPAQTIAEQVVQMVELAKHNGFNQLKFITLNFSEIHNNGGSIITQLYATIAYIVDFIEKSNLSAETIFYRTQLTYATGTNYFFEIAKYRSIKLLWKNLLETYQLPDFPPTIRSNSSFWVQPEKDVETNLLRHTTEAMSAVLGGVDYIRTYPFTKSNKYTDEFKERIAKNISLILKEESFLAETADIPAGSYYIESLTDALTQKAWQKFLDIEKNGGFFKYIENRLLENDIKQFADKQKQALENGEKTLIGVNKYINPNEQQ